VNNGSMAAGPGDSLTPSLRLRQGVSILQPKAFRFSHGKSSLSPASPLGLLLICLLAPCQIFAGGEARKLYPTDDGGKDSSFRIFRQGLLKAVQERDKEFVLSVLDPHILNSFGGEGGIQEFEETWHLDSPKTGLWDTLMVILTHGGSLSQVEDGDEFWAPYIYSVWPQDIDPFDHGAIMGKDVNVRSRPSLQALVVRQLSFDIVRLTDDPPVPDEDHRVVENWVKITTPQGEEGYVSSRYVRGPIDYRAGFKKLGNRWVMKALVAGD
jgi:hypothetical protein